MFADICGDDEIRAKTAQTNIKVLAREIPYTEVLYLRPCLREGVLRLLAALGRSETGRWFLTEERIVRDIMRCATYARVAPSPRARFHASSSPADIYIYIYIYLLLLVLLSYIYILYIIYIYRERERERYVYTCIHPSAGAGRPARGGLGAPTREGKTRDASGASNNTIY